MVNMKRLFMFLLSALTFGMLLSFGATPDNALNALSVTYLDGKTEQIEVSHESTITFDENKTMNVANGDKSSSISIDGISHFHFIHAETSGISATNIDSAIIFDGNSILVNTNEVWVYSVSGLQLAHIRQQAPINIDINNISDKLQALIIHYANGRTIKIAVKQ